MHLLEVATANLDDTDTSGLDRTTMVVHVDGSSLQAAGDGRDPDVVVPVTDGAGRVAAMSVKVLRRLACDAGVVLMVEDGEGLPIDVTHHRFVHDHDWTGVHDGRGRFAFAPPGGEALASAGRLAGAPTEAGRPPEGPGPRRAS